MRKSVWLIAVFLLAGCQSRTRPVSKLEPIESFPFSPWPSVTEMPVPVDLSMWFDCAAPTPQELAAESKIHGPHAKYSIFVRVSPEAIDLFREGKLLPQGAIVVKEKHLGLTVASLRLHAYARMIKREPGYYPEGGDWEYEYVDLIPERKETRGRLAECAACHASAKDRDYLFRSYGYAGQ